MSGLLQSRVSARCGFSRSVSLCLFLSIHYPSPSLLSPFSSPSPPLEDPPFAPPKKKSTSEEKQAQSPIEIIKAACRGKRGTKNMACAKFVLRDNV